jgi:hypothetical protein
VRLSDRLGWYELVPARKDSAGEDIRPTTGFVFVPGARVDYRAYALVLRPLAEAGFLVVVLKEPFGFAVLDLVMVRRFLIFIRKSATGLLEVTRSVASWLLLWPMTTIR